MIVRVITLLLHVIEEPSLADPQDVGGEVTKM